MDLERLIRGALMTMLAVVWTVVYAAAEMKNIVGTAGQSITLPTGLTEVGDSNIFWEFGKDRSNLEYMDEFKGRIHIDKGTGSVLITNLNLNDTGLYHCQVLNGASSYHDFNLTVLLPVSTSTELDRGISPGSTLTTSPPTNHSGGAIVSGIVALVAVIIIGLAHLCQY